MDHSTPPPPPPVPYKAISEYLRPPEEIASYMQLLEDHIGLCEFKARQEPHPTMNVWYVECQASRKAWDAASAVYRASLMYYRGDILPGT